MKRKNTWTDVFREAERILICGDRNWTKTFRMKRYFQLFNPEVVIIQGAAPGADLMAQRLAQEFELDYMGFPARWKKQKRAAGPIRNSRQLKKGLPDLTIGFHNNIRNSKGTKDMLCKSLKAGVPTYLISSTDEFQGSYDPQSKKYHFRSDIQTITIK